MDEHQQLIEDIVQAQWVVLSAMQAASQPDWMELEMTMAQIKALFVISQSTGTSINQIAEYLNVGQPTASQLVDRLVRSGLAERSEGEKDRRVKHVSLTEQGEDLVRRLYRGGEEPYRAMLASVDLDDLLALRRGLQAIARTALLPSPGTI